ncbi:MAG: hypothetical protein K6C68_09265 [Ruminococcus sp.]|nr:hypothetical protein [Ruminococcus sp.]
MWSKKWASEPKKISYEKPTVLTKEQAAELEKKVKNEQVLTKFAKGSILEGGYDERDILRAITQQGSNFVTKEIDDPESLFGELVELVKSDDNYYDIKAHGSPEAVKIFGSLVDAQGLARIIVMRGDYNGKTIRLLCCETGKLKDGTCFAKELSELLGVDVLAPTEDINISTLGNVEIISEDGVKGEMKLFKKGAK